MRYGLILACVVATRIAVAAPDDFPQKPPHVLQPDLSFLTENIPVRALSADSKTGEPVARWDRDGDGVAELHGQWNKQAQEFTTWELVDPETQGVIWRLELGGRDRGAQVLSWDADGDGALDWQSVDNDRDGKPEEILWLSPEPEKRTAQFLDRNGDGRFETRLWVDFTQVASRLEGGRRWAFDNDGDGIYEHHVPGDRLTEGGYDPAQCAAIVAKDPGREDMRWELVVWHEARADAEEFRKHALAYAADPEGNAVYRLIYFPLTRRLFHSDAGFRDGLLSALGDRAADPRSGYVVPWTLAELLRWRSTPPEVHPLLLDEWRRRIGLGPEADLPKKVDIIGAQLSERWFRRSLSRERMAAPMRDAIMLHMATLLAAQGRWSEADTLIRGLLADAEAAEGPISPVHLEVANFHFAYGDYDTARRLYAAMAAYYENNPGDPERARPNHIALIRLGLMAYDEGDLKRARYYLARAQDTLSKQCGLPDTVLAHLLLATDEPQCARDYLQRVAELFPAQPL